LGTDFIIDLRFFLARVATGPRFSPLALIVTKILVPFLNYDEKLVPGNPKRFAQSIGLIVTGLCLMFIFGHYYLIAVLLLTILAAFAFLESVFAYCFGCQIFGLLMKTGLISESVCLKCADYFNYK